MRDLRALVERGQSPAKAKRALSTEQKLADARRLSFHTFAQRWVDETLFYRSGGYVAQTVRWLDAYVYPAIGDTPVPYAPILCAPFVKVPVLLMVAPADEMVHANVEVTGFWPVRNAGSMSMTATSGCSTTRARASMRPPEFKPHFSTATVALTGAADPAVDAAIHRNPWEM